MLPRLEDFKLSECSTRIILRAVWLSGVVSYAYIKYQRWIPEFNKNLAKSSEKDSQKDEFCSVLMEENRRLKEIISIKQEKQAVILSLISQIRELKGDGTSIKIADRDHGTGSIASACDEEDVGVAVQDTNESVRLINDVLADAHAMQDRDVELLNEMDAVILSLTEVLKKVKDDSSERMRFK